ncbi:MAG: FGGY-family carbohydrate kinase [Lachnospiraceae bacterium]|nr:FGGY-family carbohydrate kinase [Lachnospiraceae bacterium]
MNYILSYDVGTTGVKSCLFGIEDTIVPVGGEYCTYKLYILENGGAEQDADEWWEAIKTTTGRLIERTKVDPADIIGISFCSQMQGLVLVDSEGRALRRPMSYMDQRAGDVMRETETFGISVAGVNIRMLLKSLRLTTAASTSVKDPLWKYKWVQKNEPEIFEKVYKWLDVKEYFICRMTGECVMTPDSAYSTFLYDSRKGKEGFSRDLCKMYGVNYDHLPRIIGCSEVAGRLLPKAAEELGLMSGTPVYGGGGDATLIGVGAGATKLGDTHVYWGTSGWVGTVIDRQIVDINAMIAGIVGAQQDSYNYFAEMETAGKCFEWVKDHLVMDEINVYLKKVDVAESVETEYVSLYDYMSSEIAKVPAGSEGVIFTPWLHGNRCPFEDPAAGGMFFNIRLETGKRVMLRAVLEGICYHLRWMLECEDRKIQTSEAIRFGGGGALSRVTCAMLADITGRTIETVEMTKDVGAVGAALLVAVGQGKLKDLHEADKLVKVDSVYRPNRANREVYDRNYRVFKRLYESNKKNFRDLNGNN